MMKRNWLQALCAAVCVLALAGCGGGECDSPADCVDKKGPAPEGREYQCVENACSLRDRPNPEPTCTPACGAGEFCDAASGQAVCRTCTATRGCAAPLFCDAAANSGKGVCRACSDTGNGTDQGCSAAAPVCDAAGGSGAGVCRTCVDSVSGGAADQGCSASTPMCDPAAGNGAGVCKACVDSTPGNAQDLGCSASAPVCDPASAGGVGACKACVDSAQGTGTDVGCGDTAPICNTAANGGRGVCRACLDSAQGTDTDQGCSASVPVCDTAAGGGAGMCRSCVDSAQGTDMDLGCSGSSPICDVAANSGAGVCRSCADTAQGTGTDLGCGAGSPICDTAANSGAGQCKLCVNTAGPGSNTADLGCSSPTAICDATAGNGVGACRVCVANEGCPGSQTCNAEGTACEGCEDSTSCNPGTPICRPTPPPSVCVECTENAQCAATRPACSSATGFCGCTGDAQCAATQGDTDFCDTAANNTRGECKVCVTDSNCLSVDATRPFCDNQTACIQCRVHTDCQLSEVCNPTSKSCEPVPGATPEQSSAQIAAVLAAADGTITPALPIENTFVTYIKPALGTDVAGFFLQSEPIGPAIFVSDATALEMVRVGDRITLQVTGKVTTSGIRTASAVTGTTIISRGHPVQNPISDVRPGLVMDRSTATDLQSALTNYESEIITLTGRIAAASSGSGSRHVAFNITTEGITAASNNFRLRVPDTLPDEIDLVPTCEFTLRAGPMWRFTSGTADQAQPSAYSASDLRLFNCPAPRFLSAAAISSTQVLLTFDRRIDPATVLPTGAQFTFSDGLTASAATVSGRQITVTTGEQTGGTNYTLTVANTVKDLSGTSVSSTANTATFRGYRTPAVLRITEVQPNMTGNTDLVELVAITGGTVDGFVLQQDMTASTPVVTLATFPNATVATGDFIVVHMVPPAGYASETTAKDQFPQSGTAINYDTAWDFAGGTTAITFSSRVLVVRDAVGNIQDGAAFARTSGTPPGAFPGNLQALQAAGHWLPVDCGGAPCSFTSTPTALQVSADWTSVPASNVTPASNTIRRVSASDTNTKDDWAVGAPSWGAPNP